MANPGILRVLRSVPRAKAGADTGLGAEQSSGGADRVTVESWTLKVVVLLLLLRHLVVVDLGDLTVGTGQA